MTTTTRFRIWYYKKNTCHKQALESFRNGGTNFEDTHGLVVPEFRLSENEDRGHILLNLDAIFAIFNNYATNPLADGNGDGQALIRSLGVSHTSMSVGDIIEYIDANENKSEAYRVALFGFNKLQ